jgi:hypothetical protein
LEGNKGSAEADVDNLLKQFGAEGSESLKITLQKYNGGFHYLETFKGLTLDEITKVGQQNDLQAQKIVPVARDIDG